MKNRLFSTRIGLTTMVTSEVDDNAVSLAVSRRTYVPEFENDAVVLSAFTFPNVTVPGPLNFDHVVIRVPFGIPSSVADPDRFEPAGIPTRRSFDLMKSRLFSTRIGLTAMVTSEVDDSAVSLAVKRKTYVPEVENDAVVLSAFTLPNVTV